MHTNAYDEAITTPTEESVRRALAIQLIINRELGMAKNENPLQGAFIVEELTDLVEEAVLAEFRRISDRGGVLGAMETMYQRGKIQEEHAVWRKSADGRRSSASMMEAVKVCVARVDLQRAVPGGRAVPAQHVGAGAASGRSANERRSHRGAQGPRVSVRAGRREPVPRGPGRRVQGGAHGPPD